MSAPKQPIRREAGQSVEEMALQMSGQGKNHLTAIDGKREQYPEVAARMKAEAVSEAIDLHRETLKTIKRNGRIQLDDVDAVARAADAYLAACGQAGVVPTMLGFSACLGYSRKHVYAYIASHSNQTTEFLDALRSSWAAIMAQMALNRQLSEPVSIFLLKNSGQGLVDKQEYEIAPRIDPLDELDPASAKHRILAALPDPDSD